MPVQGGSSFENLGLAIEAAAAGLGVAIAIESGADAMVSFDREQIALADAAGLDIVRLSADFG